MSGLPNGSPRRKVLIFFNNRPNAVKTDDQAGSIELVDRIVTMYGEVCEIKRHITDYIPGERSLGAAPRLSELTDMACVIVTEEYMGCRRTIVDQDMVFLKNLQKNKKLAVIGIGITEEEMDPCLLTRIFNIYPDFESVQKDEFLDGIFLDGKLLGDSKNQYPIEECGTDNSPSLERGTTPSPGTLEHGTDNSLSLKKGKTPSAESLELDEGNETPSSGSDSRITKIWRKKYPILVGIIAFTVLYKFAPLLNIDRNVFGAIAMVSQVFVDFEFTSYYGIIQEYFESTK